MENVIKTRMCRHLPGGWLLFLLPWTAFSQIPANSADVPPVELFKQFIASPPPIESVVYRVKLPPVKGSAIPIETGGLKSSTNYTHYEGRWQPGAFLFREVPSLSDLENRIVYGQAAINFEKNYCVLDTTFHPTATFWSHNNRELDSQNPVYFISSTLEEQFSVVLNMGINHLRVGTIKWAGDSFHQKSHLRHIDVQGTLSASPEKFPAELKLVYSDADPPPSSHIVRYSYTTNLGLSYLPNEIRHYFIYKGQEVELGEIQILALKVAPAPMDQKMFDPTPFITANHMEINVYTNEGLFAVNKIGQLTSIPRSGNQNFGAADFGKISVLSYTLVYSLFAMALGAFLILLRRCHLKNDEFYPG